VELKLLSRPEGHPTEPWRLRVAIVVAVTSTKLTEETFDAMVGI
jgi:hypothetical protein